ncbi:hypothetical protein EPO15_05315, partial [bacterium]
MQKTPRALSRAAAICIAASFVALGISLPAAAGPFTAGGAVVGAPGLKDTGFALVVDTQTAGGPFVFVSFVSTSGTVGSQPSVGTIVKYSSTGVALSSVSLAYGDAGRALAAGPSGSLYVMEGDGAGAVLSRYSNDLAWLGSVGFGSDVGGAPRMTSDGTNAYVSASSGTTEAHVKVIAFSPSLVAVATGVYSLLNASPGTLTVDPSGVLLMASSGTSRHLVKFSPDLSAQIFDVDVTALVSSHFYWPLVVGTDIYLGSGSGASAFLRKFDLSGNYTGVSSTFSGVAGNTFRKMALGPDGNIYAVGGTSVAAGAVQDILVVAYDTNLNQLSTASFNGTADGADFGRDLVVLASTAIFVTGQTFNGSDYDAVTAMLSLGQTSGYNYTFTGGFASPDGALIGAGGGFDAWGWRVVKDTGTPGGPYSYVLFGSSVAGHSRGNPSLAGIAKYDPAGVLLASVTLMGNDSLDPMATDGAGNIFVREVTDYGTGQQKVYLSKYGPTLAKSTAAQLSGLWPMDLRVANGSVYLLSDGGYTAAHCTVERYDLDLNHLGSINAPDGAPHALDLTVDQSGVTYVLVSTYSETVMSGPPYLLAKFDASLTSTLAAQDVSALVSVGNPTRQLALSGAGLFVLDYSTGAQDLTFIRKYSNSNLAYTGQSSTFTGFWPISLTSANDGSLLVAGNGDGGASVHKYDATPAFLSSASVQSNVWRQADDLAAFSATDVVLLGTADGPAGNLQAVAARLTLAPTPAPGSALTASGSFGVPGGAALSGNGGTNDQERAVLVDTVTAGGPFVYTVLLSTTGSVGAAPPLATLVKYGPTG